MEGKKCTSCLEIKPITEFYKQTDRKNGTSYCKKCHNQYCITRWKNTKLRAIKAKGSQCQDCGIKATENNYPIFDFHHRDPSTKEASWNKMRLWGESKRESELNKCDLLCSNCHRLRHHNEVPPA